MTTPNRIELIIQTYSIICNTPRQRPEDLISLKNYILISELIDELSFLKQAYLFKADFPEALLKRLKERNENTLKRYLPFAIYPDSPSNTLYQEITEICFPDNTPVEVLKKLYPPARFFVKPLLCEDDDSLTLTTFEARKKLRDEWPYELVITPIETTLELPAFNHLVISDEWIFDPRPLQQFPLGSLKNLLQELQTEHNDLYRKLLIHNQSFMALQQDIKLYENNTLTPKEAFIALIKGLTLSGTKVTGQLFTGQLAEQTLQQFFNYFHALPEPVQQGINNLQYNQKSIRIIFETQLAKGECVETIGNELRTILEANISHPLLNTLPELTRASLQQLKTKYRDKPHHPGCLQIGQDASLLPIEVYPQTLLEQTLQTISPNSNATFIMTLINFPVGLYTAIFGTIKPYIVSLDALSEYLRTRIFNNEQSIALINAVQTHYNRLHRREPFLHWVVNCGYAHLTPEYIRQFPKTTQIQLIAETDIDKNTILHKIYDQPDVFKAVASLIDTTDLFNIINTSNIYSMTALHYATKDVVLLQMILSFFSENEGLSLITTAGEKKNPLLQHAAFHHYGPFRRASFLFILSLYPEEKKLAAINQRCQYGNTALYNAAPDSETLKMLLNYYPENEQLNALKQCHTSKNNIIFQTCKSPESLEIILNIYPENERLAAITAMDICNEVTFHRAIEIPQSLYIILKSLPAHQRLTALTSKDAKGNNALHYAAQYPNSLKITLNLLTKNEQLIALTRRNSIGDTSLHAAAENQESLEIILNQFLPNDRLVPVMTANRHEDTILNKTIHDPEKIETILRLLPVKDRLTAVEAMLSKKNMLPKLVMDYAKSLKAILSPLLNEDRFIAITKNDNFGYSLLHYAAEYPQVLKLLLDLCPSNARLTALKIKCSSGNTPLHFIAANNQHSNSSELLRYILTLYPEHERLYAVTGPNDHGYSVLHAASNSFEQISIILTVTPEQDRLKLLKTIIYDHGQPLAAALTSDIISITDSFTEDYLFIYHALLSSYHHHGFFSEPIKRSELIDFMKADYFLEVKQWVIRFLSDADHSTSRIGKIILERLAGENGSLASLRERWGITTDALTPIYQAL